MWGMRTWKSVQGSALIPKDSVTVWSFKKWIRVCLTSSTDPRLCKAVWEKIQTPTRMDDDT